MFCVARKGASATEKRESVPHNHVGPTDAVKGHSCHGGHANIAENGKELVADHLALTFAGGDHAPHPSKGKKRLLTVSFRCVPPMVMDGCRFLDFFGG